MCYALLFIVIISPLTFLQGETVSSVATLKLGFVKSIRHLNLFIVGWCQMFCELCNENFILIRVNTLTNLTINFVNNTSLLLLRTCGYTFSCDYFHLNDSNLNLFTLIWYQILHDGSAFRCFSSLKSQRKYPNII